MRILKFFFTGILLTTIGVSLLLLLGREVLLLWASSVMQDAYASIAGKNHSASCNQQFGYAQDSYGQIRFVSDRDYRVEVVCHDFTSTPVLLDQAKLPPLVRKSSANSGFIWSDRLLPNFIELQVLGRKLWLYTDAGQLQTSYLSKADLDYGLGPSSVCSAYNYTCCDLQVQSGVGEQLSAATDCPRSCYGACLLRPVLLSFNSRPFMNPENRTIELRAGESLSLSYVISGSYKDVFAGQLLRDAEVGWWEKLQAFLSNDPSQSQSDQDLVLPITVNIDLGDGQTWQSQQLQDTLEHTYFCATPTCFFQISLSAADGRGVLSVDNELAKMIVRVIN